MTKWEICGTIFFVDCYLGLEDSKWHAIVSFYRKVRFQCQISLMILDQLSLELSSMKPILLVLLPFVFVIIFFERNSVNRKHIRLLKGKKQEKKSDITLKTLMFCIDFCVIWQAFHGHSVSNEEIIHVHFFVSFSIVKFAVMKTWWEILISSEIFQSSFYRGVIWTLSKIYDGAFCEKSQRLLIINYFGKRFHNGCLTWSCIYFCWTLFDLRYVEQWSLDYHRGLELKTTGLTAWNLDVNKDRMLIILFLQLIKKI